MKYYLVSLRYENYEVIRQNGFSIMGFPERSHIVEAVEPGDKLVLYVGSRKSVIAGIVEATSKYFYDNKLIWDEVFPKRIKIQEYKTLKMQNFIPIKSLIEGLSFVDETKERYGLYFMQAIRQLNDEDYKLLYDEVIKTI